jgi:hypothetical protein
MSVQDRCTVCAKHTIGPKIIIDTPDGTPRLRGLIGISFWSVWMQDRCMVRAKRTLGSEIILDEPNGTP